MTTTLWLSFCLTTLLLDLTPGPSVMMAVGVTISRNLKEGIKTVAGLQSGSLVWFTAAVIAMLSSYKISSQALGVLSVLGAMYLVYLGLKTFVPLPDPLTFHAIKKLLGYKLGTEEKTSAFLMGLLTQLANPKCYLYWLAFLPQFQPSEGPTLEHNLLLLALATMSTVPTLLAYVCVANKAKHLFIDEKWQKRLDWLSGTVLIALGAWMLTRHFGLT